MRKLKQVSVLLLAAILIFTTVDIQGMRVNANEKTVEVPTTEEPSSEETSKEEASTEETSTEEPTTEKTTTEEPTTEEPSTEEVTELTREQAEQLDKLKELIDALPNLDEINEENREQAMIDLQAVLFAYEALFEGNNAPTAETIDSLLGEERIQKLTELQSALLEIGLFSNNSMSETRFGLTVTQTNGGEKGFTMGSKDYDGYVYISKPGSYTITGTGNAKDIHDFTKDWVSRNPNSIRGLIEIDNNIQGTVDLTLNNVDVTTNYWQTPPLVISKSVGAASVNSSTDVNIILKGDNKLTTTSDDTAAIVKQGGSGTLTFGGSGSLTATGVGVAIGSPALYYASDNVVTPNCNNIVFKHSGTITAINSSGADAVVGTSGNFDATQRTRYVSNIQLQSGTLILQSNQTTQTDKKSILGGGRLSEASQIKISGGTLKIPGSSAGSEFIAVGSGGNRYNAEFENSSVFVTGGTIISEYKVLKPQNSNGTRVYKTVVDCGTGNAKKAVESLAITIDGEPYSYGITDVTTDESGKLYLYLPYTGSASVTVFDRLYYGKVSDPNENILQMQFIPLMIGRLPTLPENSQSLQ